MWYFWVRDAQIRVPPSPHEFSCQFSRPAPWGPRAASGAADWPWSWLRKSWKNSHSFFRELHLHGGCCSCSLPRPHCSHTLKKKKKNNTTKNPTFYIGKVCTWTTDKFNRRVQETIFYFTITFNIEVNMPWMFGKRDISHINQNPLLKGEHKILVPHWQSVCIHCNRQKLMHFSFLEC